MAGFNSTIFAYGQTGSGKTHTMTGTEGEVGIIPLAVSGVFEAIEQNPGRNYLLRVSYLEIYNEGLRDILNCNKKPLGDNEKPSIHLENVSILTFYSSSFETLELISLLPVTLVGRSYSPSLNRRNRSYSRRSHVHSYQRSKEPEDRCYRLE